MKKVVALALTLLLVTLTACSGSGSSKKIEKLSVVFVPSRDADSIKTATEPLKQLIIDQMATHGYTIGSVDISVSQTYEAAGEAMTAGTADVGFLPAGTYVTYQPDGVDVILAATRAGLNKDFTDAKAWNDGLATTNVTDQVTYYRSLIYATTTTTVGKALVDKVNAGTALTFDDVNNAKWCTSSSTSSAGYIYPTLWLQSNFGKKITDLKTSVQTTSYSDTASRMASGQCDIGVGYADIRVDYAKNWTADWGKTDIYKEMQVIGVTDKIMNDTISVSKASKAYSKDFVAALQESFIALAKTDAGAKAIKIYNHTGYQVVTDADYDSQRAAMKAVQGN